MALADWTLVSDQTPSWTLTSTYSIVPTFSGAVYGVSPDDPAVGSWAVGYTATLVNKTCGLIRCMYQSAPTVRGLDNFGVFAQMQTSLDVTSTAYIALVKMLGQTVSLHKGTIINANVEHGLVQVPYIPEGDLTVYALQLNWQLDSSSGNMLLIVSVDGPISDPATYDYSTLVPVISYTDISSPLTTGYTVGLAGRIEPVGTPGHYQVFDNIDIITD